MRLPVAGAPNPDEPTLESLAERLEKVEKRLDTVERHIGTFIASSEPFSTLPLPHGVPRPSQQLRVPAALSGQEVPFLSLSDEGEVTLAMKDGSQAVKITTIQGMPAWPLWAADGKMAGFTLPEPASNSAVFQVLPAAASSLHASLADSESTAIGSNYAISFPERTGLPKEWILHDATGLIQRAGLRPAQSAEQNTRRFGGGRRSRGIFGWSLS